MYGSIEHVLLLLQIFHSPLYTCPAQDVYLEFIEKTDNSITLRRCDDCSSDAIDISLNPVPFGDYYHYVAHVRLST